MGSVRTRVVAAIFALALAVVPASAQVEATIVGIVMDESKAVLPGVTVTATDLATGRQFVDVTNVRGEYRLVGMQAAKYKVQAELTGFAPSILPEVELLVGQNATIGFTLKLAGVEEALTVSGTAPLVDTRQAQVSGNVDRRQMEDLPLNGRNWLQLSTMIKGITANQITDISSSTPNGSTRTASFRVNLDGQEITQETSVSGFGQPGISRDAIAEYQIVTNMFDITMGRSIGLQLQAISKAGTNNYSGSTYGYFRSDKLNAADAYTNKVLPYSNQQVGATFGGPLIKDQMQYFLSYEYQREPNTTVVGPAVYQGATITLPTDTYQHYALGRVDYQLDSKDHLLIRGNYFNWSNPHYLTSTTSPTRDAERFRHSDFLTGNWSRVISNNLLQELKVNWFHYEFINAPLKDGPSLAPEYIFPALTIGPNWNYPEDWNQDHVTATYDLKLHTGSHDIKLGSELSIGKDAGWWRPRSRGQMFFSATPANFAGRFPLSAWQSPSQWDFSGLDSIATRYDIYYAPNDDWGYHVPRPMYAGWLGDTWTVTNRLTLNLGVRYDVAWNDFISPGNHDTTLIINNGFNTADYGYKGNIRDLHDVAPRVGFAWNVTGKSDFVIRGGSGIFYGTQGSNKAVAAQLFGGQRFVVASFKNDGKPGFVLDPTRGITANDVLSGKVALPPQTISVIQQGYQMPSTWQSMLGFQKQLSDVMGVDADLVYYKGVHQDEQLDPNVFYDPVTGFPKNPSAFGRPDPAYGPINLKASTGYSDYFALPLSFTRRYRNNFQFGFTYTLMFFMRDTGIGTAGYGNQQLNPFNLSQDWARSTEFQRHTVNANGVWNLPYGLLFAGSFHYGSGNYATITSPADPLGQVNGARRVLSDLTVLPRNTFLMDPWQSLDMRVSKDFRIGTAKLTGIAELFNVYNYARFNRNTIYGNALFGQPTSSAGIPRTGQLAVRFAF
jgi:hypothetical protein